MADNDWLFEASGADKIKRNKVLVSLEKADDALRSRRCNTAKKRLVYAISKDSKKGFHAHGGSHES